VKRKMKADWSLKLVSKKRLGEKYLEEGVLVDIESF